MITPEVQQLTQLCDTIIRTIPQTVDWVNQFKIVPQENKLGLNKQLGKYRRDTQRYKSALLKRPSVAIFGQSQVGKSYLVSNLVKPPEADDLDIVGTNAQERIDFIEKINPPGDGKEATGIVSRFTVAYDFNTAHPYLLKMLSQADILRVIINGYFSDLMNYADDSYINPEQFKATLSQLRSLKTGQIFAGFSEDDVYDVKEYIQLNFKNHHIADGMVPFWDDLADLIPYLPANQRWRAFEVFWSKRQFFTDLFNKLSAGLEQLSFAPEVECGMEATPDKYKTIIDVERLRELFKPEMARTIPVYLPGGLSVQMDMSVLSALTAEIVLRLEKSIAQHPQRAFLQYADVLDFPGARSREKTPESTFLQNNSIEKLQLFLRGKIAFLFDRYNFNHEISTLLYCHDNTPQNVKTIPHLLYDWIQRTHGGSPDERTEREQRLSSIITGTPVEKLNPLLFVLTKFNFELSKREKSAAGHDGKWASRLWENFHDFMSQPLTDKWPGRWTERDPNFRNSFLLRDPNPKFAMGVYEQTPDGKEQFSESYAEQLEFIKQSFLTNQYVSKHFRDTKTAWDEAVTPEKSGGINYIVEYLTPTCNPKIRVERLKMLIEQAKQNVISAFENYVDSGDLASKLRKAKMTGAKVFMSMMNWVKETNAFGYFLDQLTLRENEAWEVYWNFQSAPPVVSDSGKATSNEQSIATFKQYMKEIGITFDASKDFKWHVDQLKALFGIDSDDDMYQVIEESGIKIRDILEGRVEDKIKTEAELFSERLIEYWYAKIIALKNNPHVTGRGLNQDIITQVCTTLDRSKERIGLKKVLTKRLTDEIENFNVSNPNYDIVSHIAVATINTFVNTASWRYADETLTDYPKIMDVPIFSKTGVTPPSRDALRMDIDYPGMFLFNQWNTGIRESFMANVLFEEKAGNAEDALIKQKLFDMLRPLQS